MDFINSIDCPHSDLHFIISKNCPTSTSTVYLCHTCNAHIIKKTPNNCPHNEENLELFAGTINPKEKHLILFKCTQCDAILNKIM